MCSSDLHRKSRKNNNIGVFFVYICVNHLLVDALDFNRRKSIHVNAVSSIRVLVVLMGSDAEK